MAVAARDVCAGEARQENRRGARLFVSLPAFFLPAQAVLALEHGNSKDFERFRARGGGFRAYRNRAHTALSYPAREDGYCVPWRCSAVLQRAFSRRAECRAREISPPAPLYTIPGNCGAQEKHLDASAGVCEGCRAF